MTASHFSSTEINLGQGKGFFVPNEPKSIFSLDEENFINEMNILNPAFVFDYYGTNAGNRRTLTITRLEDGFYKEVNIILAFKLKTNWQKKTVEILNKILKTPINEEMKKWIDNEMKIWSWSKGKKRYDVIQNLLVNKVFIKDQKTFEERIRKDIINQDQIIETYYRRIERN